MIPHFSKSLEDLMQAAGYARKGRALVALRRRFNDTQEFIEIAVNQRKKGRPWLLVLMTERAFRVMVRTANTPQARELRKIFTNEESWN